MQTNSVKEPSLNIVIKKIENTIAFRVGWQDLHPIQVH